MTDSGEQLYRAAKKHRRRVSRQHNDLGDWLCREGGRGQTKEADHPGDDRRLSNSAHS